MKKESKNFTVYATVCSILMLAILCVSLHSASKRTPIIDEEPSQTFSTVYVYVTPETSVETIVESESEDGWIIREYDEIIGIFTLDGVLLNTIPTYTKTLPIADRDLLREGIAVTNREDLLSVIEDYGG